MNAPLIVSQATCPYCPSATTITTYEDGRLEIQHQDAFGPICEDRLRHLMADQAKQAGLRLMIRN